MNACPQALIDMDSPTRLHVHVSAPGAMPATVCVDNGTVNTYGITTTGSGLPSIVTWTPDPGTPIGPITI
jgi:hypothetical protein